MTDAAIRETIIVATPGSPASACWSARSASLVPQELPWSIVAEECKQAQRDREEPAKNILGTPRSYHPEETGLEEIRWAWSTAWPGPPWAATLLEVEASVMPGTGKLELTGNLGDVMKESAQAAFSYIRSRAAQLGIDTDFYKNKDIHIHFPEGAVPKDGPSAGVTITTAHGLRPHRHPACGGDVAMTGEVTLRGRVLPIGGLREKTMAALPQRHPHRHHSPGQRGRPGGDRPDRAGGALHFIPVDHGGPGAGPRSWSIRL